MIEPSPESITTQIVALLNHYGFDLGESTPEEIVDKWLNRYAADWVYYAVLEALYLGRYKAVSVEQILSVWRRKGQPVCHFSHDFERLIGRKEGQDLESFPELSPEPLKQNETLKTNLDVGATLMNVNQPEIQPLIPTENKPYLPPNLPDSTTTQNISSDHCDPVLAPPSQGITKLKRLLEHDSYNPYEPDWSRGDTTPTPIDQFTPKPGDRFHRKLRSIVNETLSQEEHP